MNNNIEKEVFFKNIAKLYTENLNLKEALEFKSFGKKKALQRLKANGFQYKDRFCSSDSVDRSLCHDLEELPQKKK